MVFSSVTFLFFFLPLVLLVYSAAGNRFRNPVLLLASLLFYCWGEGLYLLVMLGSILTNYLCGKMMVRSDGSPVGMVLVIGLLFNVLLLSSFKYGNFLVDNLNVGLQGLGLPVIHLGPIHLPIGISFFTFQAISYIVDVYTGRVRAQRRLVSLGLYIALFPQLIAGPIVRYQQIAGQLGHRQMALGQSAAGVQRFLFGLGKKVLIANPLAAVADQIFALPASELSPSVAWFGAICYTFQIYFDFSGYSDMAIGLGRIFGFRFPENFNYPYWSTSITEFWRRWHISLSSWFKDYLYIPLGGNRHGAWRTYRNLLIVFLLCGLWHGASWSFVLWGLYHGLFLVIERTRVGRYWEKTWQPLQISATFCIVVFGWVLFRCDNLPMALGYLAAMFGLADAGQPALLLPALVDRKVTFEIGLAILLAGPIFPVLRLLHQKIYNSMHGTRIAYAGFVGLIRLSVLVILTYFTVISLAAGVYNPFIYFRF
jgi:alginate O-acetyltransferase complex protein AlgI